MSVVITRTLVLFATPLIYYCFSSINPPPLDATRCWEAQDKAGNKGVLKEEFVLSLRTPALELMIHLPLPQPSAIPGGQL